LDTVRNRTDGVIILIFAINCGKDESVRHVGV